MSGKLTIQRKFHVTTRRDGRKCLENGQAPARPLGRVPRIVRLLALAHHCRNLIRDGVIINQSELAHYGQISTTRVTQIMWLDNLAPDIQEEILGLPRTVRGRDAVLEKHVRPIAKTHDWKEQRKMWADLGVFATLRHTHPTSATVGRPVVSRQRAARFERPAHAGTGGDS